jgi:ATP-dependent helicase YprA (DUF1998 family)
VGENEESRRQKAEGRREELELRSQKSGEDGSGAGAQPNPESRIRDLESKTGGSEARVEVVAFEPNIYLYDKYPGGVGLSEPLFRMGESLLEKAQRLIANCPCASGCPSCVGPIGEVGEKGKEVALEILKRLSVVRGA